MDEWINKLCISIKHIIHPLKGIKVLIHAVRMNVPQKDYTK